MPKPVQKPLMISPVPASATPPVSRAMRLKRLSRVRVSWFVIGSLCGVAASFFMNFLITALILPEYQQFAQKKTPLLITEAKAADASLVTQSAIKTAQVESDAKQAKNENIAKLELAKKESVKTEEAKQSAKNDAAKNDTAKSEIKTDVAKEEGPVTYPQTLALQIGRGDTLLSMLIAHRVQPSEANSIITALKAKINPQKLPVGQKISVTLARHETLGDKAAVKELAIKLPNFDTIELQRTTKGAFNVAAMKEELTQHAYRGYGLVKTSLLQAGTDGHIPSSAINEVVRAFSYDVDFQREIHPGDTIEVLMDRKTAEDGRVGGYGPPRYAALTLHGKKHEIFRFKNSFGDLAWFDGQGNNIKKSLLRTPINAAHITSGFGMRMHPLLGYTKMHKGVDFGAETGTPIMAAGDGTVEFKGWQNGYGNFVIIKHNATYETAYGHISKFGNISVGNRVRQGQVIAYVGMTGGATGPHLHYEVRQNEQQVNPVSKQFNLANGLTGKSLAAFNAGKGAALQELAQLKNPNAKVKTALAKPVRTAEAKSVKEKKANRKKLKSA